MNMHPVHYAPHHTGNLPLCGTLPDRASNGGLVMCTLKRDLTTCFRCIDQYEERAATPEQVKALAEARDAIDEAMAGLEEQIVFDEQKKAMLAVLTHMLEAHTPWWEFRRRFRLRRAIAELRTLKLEDLK